MARKTVSIETHKKLDHYSKNLEANAISLQRSVDYWKQQAQHAQQQAEKSQTETCKVAAKIDQIGDFLARSYKELSIVKPQEDSTEILHRVIGSSQGILSVALNLIGYGSLPYNPYEENKKQETEKMVEIVSRAVRGENNSWPIMANFVRTGK